MNSVGIAELNVICISFQCGTKGKRSRLEMFVLVFRLACRDSEDYTGNENLIIREKIFNRKF